eukprot:scaffold10571_cov154-Cylindrotheca_fusiformis.AAC.12
MASRIIDFTHQDRHEKEGTQVRNHHKIGSKTTECCAMAIRNRKQTMIVPCPLMILSLFTALAVVFGEESILLRGEPLNRRLSSRQVQFIDECSTELLIDTVLGDKMISQVDFTETFYHLCTSFDVSDCDEDATFETLDKDIQFAFAFDLCHDKSSICLQSLISLSKVSTEVGYVVSSQPGVVQNLVNNICVELAYAVLGESASSDGMDLIGVDSGPSAGARENGTNKTNVAGAAIAGSACLVLLYLLAGQHKRRQQYTRFKDIESNNSYKTESSPDPDFSIDEMTTQLRTPLPPNRRTPTSDFIPYKGSEIDGVFEAIGNRDWYQVYSLASRLSEREDLSTMSSFTMQDSQWSHLDLDLSHLSLEDQHRTRTLDRLAKNRDWTGVAVTASLYVDESTASEESSFCTNGLSGTQNIFSPSLGILKDRIDTAVDSGDWERVLALSSVAEDTDVFDDELPTLLPQSDVPAAEALLAAKKTLTEALHQADWALVGVYANKIRELKYQATDSESSAPIPATASIRIDTFDLCDSADTDAVKKQTIANLINDGKWKGVSIMAGLYDMESNGCLSTLNGNEPTCP